MYIVVMSVVCYSLQNPGTVFRFLLLTKVSWGTGSLGIYAFAYGTVEISFQYVLFEFTLVVARWFVPCNNVQTSDAFSVADGLADAKLLRVFPYHLTEMSSGHTELSVVKVVPRVAHFLVPECREELSTWFLLLRGHAFHG